MDECMYVYDLYETTSSATEALSVSEFCSQSIVRTSFNAAFGDLLAAGTDAGLDANSTSNGVVVVWQCSRDLTFAKSNEANMLRQLLSID